MIKKNLTVVIAACLGMTGCGLFGDSFRDRGDDYQLAEEAAVLEVPEGYHSDTLGELFVVPPIPDDSLIPGEFEVPRPQRPSETSFEQQVKLQTLNDKRWALVQASPSEVWPRVRNALSRNALPAAMTDAPKGVMETVWVTFKDDEDNSHRFRIRIEPGVQFNTTEVSVLQNQVAKGEELNAQWGEPSADLEREKQVLTTLSEALAGDVASSSVSLLAQSIGGEAKVEVVTPGDAQPYILIKLNMDRSWASVDYSVKRGGFTPVDQDRSSGTFYLNHRDADDEGGWFSGWFSSDDEDSRRIDYQVLLTEGTDGVEVRIVDQNGEPLESQEALRLLKIIRSNLS